VHAPLGHQGNEIAIAEAAGKIPTNTALDDLSRESATPVDGITFNGLRHGKLRAKTPGYHTFRPLTRKMHEGA
jgi:hypothetical protein